MAGLNQVGVAGEEVTLLAPDGTLGVEEAAQACGVSDETIRRRLRARQLPNAVRDGGPNGTWRIPLADLVAAGFSPSVGSSADDGSVDIARLQAELDAATRLLEERQARIEELQLHLSDLRSLINSREAR